MEEGKEQKEVWGQDWGTKNSQNLAAMLKEARRRLVETGTRNRLINANRTAKRANSLNIVNERTEDIFDLLRVQRKKMRFKADGSDEESELSAEDISLAQPGSNEPFDAARYQDNYLETTLGPEKLERRLLKLFYDARTSEEEQGVNILYLALGFLKWYEDAASRTLRESPLILAPVQLRRNERQGGFDLVARDEEIYTNLPLLERLKGDFGLALPEIEDSEEWRPGPYLEAVRELAAEQDRWSVDEDGMQLGLFSFAKLLMFHDLEPENWPSGGLLSNDLMRGLLAEGFAKEEPLFGPDEPLEPRIDSSELVHVVDADGSQTKMILEALDGRNIVIQGPPGTGKSQTIANMIAGAVHEGKTVLFVAEKMAALSVVHDRLRKIGLGQICVEMHSRASNKKDFLLDLQRTLGRGRAVAGLNDTAEDHRSVRNRLNDIDLKLHTPIAEIGVSPFSVIGELCSLIGRDVPPPTIKLDNISSIDERTRNELSERVSEYARILREAGTPSEHPFRGVNALDLQPTDIERLKQELGTAMNAIDDLADKASEISRKGGLGDVETFERAGAFHAFIRILGDRPPGGRALVSKLLPNLSESRLTEALQAGHEWRRLKDVAADQFLESAWETPVVELRNKIASGANSFWTRVFGPYRKASLELSNLLSVQLPKTSLERLELIDELVVVQQKRRALSDDERWLSEALGDAWRGESTNFHELLTMVEWLEEVLATGWDIDEETLENASSIQKEAETLAGELSEKLNGASRAIEKIVSQLEFEDTHGDELSGWRFTRIIEWLDAMLRQSERYSEWRSARRAVNKLEHAGLGPLVELIDTGDYDESAAVDQFRYIVAEAKWRAVMSAVPELRSLDSLDRRQMVSRFRELDVDRIDAARKRVLERHAENLPTGGHGEMGLLRGEMAKQRRHKPVRKLMVGAGGVIQRIKPVFLMSPISIAQYLPPESVSFDLLVIDEASQVRPEEALGAVARCRQIVVVGDQKQLPPTSFFDRVATDVEEEEDDTDEQPKTAGVTEVESILSLCSARGLNSGMLEWHYRSRDPSLIAVNNVEFYDHKLILPPTPTMHDDELGFFLCPVSGVYSSKTRGGGRPNTNRLEAQAVVERLAELAKDHPELSVGIVAFSKAQSDMVTELLESMRRIDQRLEEMLRENKRENVFVKNIENVQGDERDVILITVGYGPNEPNGKLSSMSFGPVNREGGERRLNVLFSRARMRCEVFCSFDPGDIDLSRTKAVGAATLKKFLMYAKSGVMDLPRPVGDEVDSPFEEDVARAIGQLGYEFDIQVGSVGFRIDIGVKDPERPGRYTLAVECDGATYHSALWARERDRLRQGVLEGMGWRFHRIWSTDWFYRRDAEIARLKAAIESSLGSEGATVVGSNAQDAAPTQEILEEPEPEPLNLEPEYDVVAYAKADVKYAGPEASPIDAPSEALQNLIVNIVEIEGPIHYDLLSRRVADAFGLKRAGSRIRERTMKIVRELLMGQRIRGVDEFVMTEAQRESPQVRDRSNEISPTTSPGFLPVAEIRYAADQIRRASGEVPDDELIRTVVRLLGFNRTGQELRARIMFVLGINETNKSDSE